MADQPYDMWTYWADKYGEIEALKHYYYWTFTNNPKLQFCVNQIEVCLDAIHAEMSKIEDENIIMEEEFK